MTAEYSVEITKRIEEQFHRAELHRPMRVECYDVGDELLYDVSQVAGANKGQIRLVVEKFVGGGFAGQVYRVKILDINPSNKQIGGLVIGGIYAMKILIPPSGFSKIFRNVIYWLGFQGPFQLQVNPAAARAGALWQKFIRRAAKIRFGSERVVADIHATFIDGRLGSCGELSEWVEGRTWQLETDDHLDALRKWKKGKYVDPETLGSPEYRAKREFMAGFVELLHDMGGQEFARQYEWSTCKSQPNCLKRTESGPSPSNGLTAIDFRAGLALLPFLPMSPGDFKLILSGLARGSLVQFDRGDLIKLEQFVESHKEAFVDLHPELDKLKALERIYRNSIPDITHNHIRLLYSPVLWSTMLDSAVTGWAVKNLIDDRAEETFRKSRISILLFFLIGIIPLFGGFFRKIWGRADWRRHYGAMLISRSYFGRALLGKMAEKIIGWYRSGRVSNERALMLSTRPGNFFCHAPLSLLPSGIHRLLSDWHYAKAWFTYLAIRPIRLYFNSELREQWLVDMVAEGRKKRLLSDEDANTILSQVKDTFIQKYLKSLAVHVCTLPVTQVVSVIVAMAFWVMNPEMSKEARGIAVAGILVAFQLTPVSPGSLVRGLYVLYLVIKEKNFKDYNIAVFLGFFKYIGYLAFPIQMTHRYPALARFMAGHWATEAVHVVPVFGERGALLEHAVFCLFYNRPLTIRRRMRVRSDIRSSLNPRHWHIALCAIAGAGIFGSVDFLYLNHQGILPELKQVWPATVFVPMLCGSITTLGAGGAALVKRITGAAVCGISLALFYTIVTAWLAYGDLISTGDLAIRCAWRNFIFIIMCVLGMLLTELNLPEPKTENV
jgi:hypothetical protein